MVRRVLVFAAAAALGLSTQGHAQNSSNQNSKPNASKPAPQPGNKSDATITLRNGVYYIGPKKPPPKPEKTGPNGLLIAPGNAALIRASYDGGSAAGLRAPQRAAASDEIVVAQQEVAGPAQNSFLIQFRPGTPQPAQDALMARYNLGVKRVLPGLVYVVYRKSVPADEPPPRTLAEAFNPPIIKRLRAEPIIANATVDAAAAPRTVPKATNTKAQDERGFTHQWTWSVSPVAPPAAATASNAASPPPTFDGNWGLKIIRMPPVWTIVQKYRAANPNAARPKLAIVDTGFFKHEDLGVNLLASPNQETPTADEAASAASAVGGPCNRWHGNHVAGIAGALYGNGIGIDGIIPDARIDAIPVLDQSIDQAAAAASTGDRNSQLVRQVLVRDALYSDVKTATQRYVDVERSKSQDLRVVNLSVGLNLWVLATLDYPLDEIKDAVKDTIVGQAQMSISWLATYEKSVLFVVAAGNDSDHLPAPLEAKWSSPLAWLATGEIDPIYKRPKNILVVEASDRRDQRANLSNIGGQIAAPGMDIMSTLSMDEAPYGVCDGTSMASPHAAAVAALMFELAPGKTPAEIIDTLVKSGVRKRHGEKGAPRLDALEAVMRLSPYTDSRNENLVRLTDLTGDGKVDAADMKEFARRLQILTDNRNAGTAFAEDLNGDKTVDANECSWPTVDFNGSGTASLSNQADARKFLGEYRNDLAILQMAWTDKTKDSATAIKETGLDAAILAADKVSAAPAPQACK